MEKKTLIINTLKEHYSEELREQLVQSLLSIEKEKSSDELSLEKSYQTMNQIFSYVLQQSGWEMGKNSKNWNSNPLQIMSEVFPQLASTLWYKENNLSINSNINLVNNPDGEKEEK